MKLIVEMGGCCDVVGHGSLPAQAVATGRPAEPDCMEGWKVDCRSNRSLSIFRALREGKRPVTSTVDQNTHDIIWNWLEIRKLKLSTM